MGAAVTMMNTNRMMSRRGGGGGSSNRDPQPEGGFFKQWGLLIYNILTFSIMVTVFILDVSKSDVFFTDIKSVVVEKKVVSELASKGRVYDEGYLRLRYETPASPMFGDVNPSYKWVNVGMTKYLNTEIGNIYTQRVKRWDRNLSFWRWAMGFCMLASCVGAGISITKAMS